MGAAVETGAADDVSAVVLDQAERLFADIASPATLRAADALAERAHPPMPREAWNAVVEAGLPLALADEAHGGIGLSPSVALALVRRAAFHAVPLPVGETMVGAALWAAAAGEVPDGVVTLAPDRLRLEGGRVSGTLRRVPWGAQADAVLARAVDADGAGTLVLLAPPREGWTRGATLAGEPRDALSLEAHPAEARPAPADLLAAGAALRATQMTGAMERALDHALAHARDRTQFGRPIGKFQAVQQMLAEAAGHLAAASATADGLGEAWGTPDLRLAAAIAKVRTGEAAGRVAAICHQVLAAMGFTQEHGLHYATRRLWSWRDEFGGEAVWEAELGRLACAGGGERLWDAILAASQPGRAR